MADQQTTSSPGFTSRKEARAHAAAEEAYRRATRPWFKKERFILPLAVILLVVIIMASVGGRDTGTAGIGKSVRDGEFAFVVTSMQRPGRTLTDRSGTTETAQGEFVIVRVNVTNVGSKAKTLAATSQFLVNDKGQRFAPSSAITSLQGADLIFLKNINPGNTVTGAPILFDVAPGTTIASIELHDSMSSTGVKVKLS